MTTTATRSAGTHRVTWSGSTPTFHCDSGPDAACRCYPACGCELWTSDKHGENPKPGHERLPGQECWVLPWLENYDPWDIWQANEFPPADPLALLRNEEITYLWSFDKEQVLWAYAPTTQEA